MEKNRTTEYRHDGDRFIFLNWRDDKTMQAKTVFVIFLLLAGLSGCASIGPGTVARDRFDYITAISDSWKSQTLLNLVT